MALLISDARATCPLMAFLISDARATCPLMAFLISDARACHVSSSQLEALDISSRLGHWMHAFESDETCFASKAVFVELRLRRARSPPPPCWAHAGHLR